VRFSPSKNGFTRNSSALLCHAWSTRSFPPLHRVPPSTRTILSPFAGRRRKLRLFRQPRCRDVQSPAHRAEQPSTIRGRERQASRRPRHNLGPERRPKRPRQPSASPQKPPLLLARRHVYVVRLLNLLRRRRLASARLLQLLRKRRNTVIPLGTFEHNIKCQLIASDSRGFIVPHPSVARSTMPKRVSTETLARTTMRSLPRGSASAEATQLRLVRVQCSALSGRPIFPVHSTCPPILLRSQPLAQPQWG
jgi:hypothetical protein